MLSSPGGTNVFTSTPHVAYSDQEEKTMVEKIAEEKQSSSYKLIDLLKFVCAFLVIGIHTRPFQASSELLDKVFYYDISNYAVPFFYACTGYFLVLNHPEETLQQAVKEREQHSVDRKSTRLNSSHITRSRMPSSA